MNTKFAIVGAGTVGSALAKLMASAGYEFVGAASRSLGSAARLCAFVGAGKATQNAPEVTCEADLVFLTTPDEVIAGVCQSLADRSSFRSGAVVAHCSGTHPSTILLSARKCGAHVGSMHPLQSFATADQAVRTLPGSYCCIEGDPEAVEALRQVAQELGARVMTIPTDAKALYHAAAVVACNFLVALENAALKLAKAAGIERADGLQALLPLIKGTVSNLEAVGIPQCLTGPIARGDVMITEHHIKAIARDLPHLLPLYKILGRETVEVGVAKGTLSEERAEQLLKLLD